MRREIKTISMPSECDELSEDEPTQTYKQNQPLDLRVNSAIERRDTDGKYEIPRIKEKSEKNFILASLLTRSSASAQIKYGENPHALPFSNSRIYTKKCESPLSLQNIYLQSTPEYHEANQSYFQDTKIRITDKLKIKQGFKDRFTRYKSWNQNYSNGLHCKTQGNINTTFDSKDDYKNTSKNFEINVESKPLIDKEFVPNYRKFYSRCSNQSPTPRTSTEGTAQEVNSANLDSCTIIRERLSSSTVAQSVQHSWKYPAYPPTGHLYRLLQRDRISPNNLQSLKRKSAYLTDMTSNDPNKKDKTLKCLLSTSVDDKGLSLTNRNQLNLSSHQNKCDYLLLKDHIKHEASKNKIYSGSIRAGCPDQLDAPSHVYCPQPVRAMPGDVVLKGLLVSNCKIPVPIPGPPSSGSPGSESTSSGSTDSGVFSDNIFDDRRRVTRVLSGKHVKSGPGASITTLRLLRQMIIERKSKSDRKL